MFKIAKRTLAIILVVAMAFSVAACGGNTGDNGNTGTSGGTTAVGDVSEYALDSDALLAKMPEKLKNTEIVFMSWYNPDDREEKPVIAEFEKKTGIDVKYIVADHSGYLTTVATNIATNTTIDVMRIKQPTIGAFKVLQPVTASGFDFSGKEWDKYTMGLYTVGEKCYAMALRYTNYFSPTMLFYNSGVMEDMGFEDPYELWKEKKWTWKKFDEMCTKWVEENGSDYLGAYLMDYPHVTMGTGFVKRSSDGITYEVDLTNQAVINGWRFIEEGMQKGLYDVHYDGFDQAKPTMLFGAMDATAVQQSSGYFNKTRLRGLLKTVPFPYWDQDGYTYDDYHVPMKENLGFGITKTAKNAEAVPYFIAYMANLANYNTGVGEGGMFFSEQAKEAYMGLLNMDKRSQDKDNGPIQYDGSIETWSWYLIKIVTPDQLNTFLQENEYKAKASTELYNQDLLAFK